MTRDETIDEYLTSAQSWETDRRMRAERDKNRAYWVAAAFGAMAAMSLLALIGLTPLKSTLPYLLRVDNSTGIVDVVPMYTGTATMPDSVTRHFLSEYVTARERYFYAIAEKDYRTVGAMNSSKLNMEWSAAWDRANTESPLNRYKDGTTVSVTIKGINFLPLADGSKDIAMVRFSTGTRQGGTSTEHIQHWASTVRFTYVEPSHDEESRALNPIGFRVIEHRREPELPQEEPLKTGSGEEPVGRPGVTP